ncbi:MAG: L17 family ribosomal protein [Candidatus Gracilibacteria bacterium]|jgi:large subunit ribosomal protein L17
MRHRSKKHLKFNGRDANHRDAVLRNIAGSFFIHKKVATTKKRAQAVVPLIHKLIRLGQEKDLMNAIRGLQESLYTEQACKAALEVAKSAQRTSGFTRMTPLKYRAGDASMLVTLELVV